MLMGFVYAKLAYPRPHISLPLIQPFTAPLRRWKCGGCKNYVRACRAVRLEVAPNVLMIGLKRYGLSRFGKVNRPLAYPERLDMSRFMASDAMDTHPVRYSLYAVVVHLDMMNSTMFGHYISFVKDAAGVWYECDDNSITKVRNPSEQASRQGLQGQALRRQGQLLWDVIAARCYEIICIQSCNHQLAGSS